MFLTENKLNYSKPTFRLIFKSILKKFEQFLNNYIALVIITSYYVSVHLFGPNQYTIFELNTSLFDIFTFVWIFWLIATKNYLKITIKYIQIELFLLLLFIIYSGIAVLHGMYGIKSLSLYLQLCRDFFIFILVFHFIQKVSIIQVNLFIFKFAFWMSILMLILYGLFLTTGSLPVNIFEYGESGSIRFEGFAGDANFYAFLMSVAFLIGFYTSSKDLKVWNKYFSLFPIAINIIITVSRSVILTLIITFLLTLFIFDQKVSRKFKNLILLISIFITFILVSFIKLPHINISIYEWYVLRSTQNTPRFAMWNILLNYFEQQPLFGYGLRASEMLLGGAGEYAHNSYLELLIDYGFLGFVIFIGFIFLVYIKSLNLIKMNSHYKAWFHSYIILIIIFGGFTLLYWPFLWVIFALILGGYTFEKNRLNNSVFQ